LLVLLVSGCRLQVDVNVDVADDGSGTLEVVLGLDADAIDKVGGDLAAVLEVDDLEVAGWVIDGPSQESDGFTRVRIRHAFADLAEANDLFGQIAGDKGPFQHFELRQTSPFAETRTEFSGSVDFSGGLEAFSDSALAAQLDGLPLGQSVDEIEAQLGESLSRILQVRVNVRLPGDVSSNATTKAANGAVWQVGFGEGATDLQATGTQRRWGPLVLAGVAALAALMLVILLLVRLAGRVTARGAAGDSAPQ
jgi:hypothetical protein